MRWANPLSPDPLRALAQAVGLSALGYGLLLLPSASLLAAAWSQGVDLSGLIERAWRPWLLWTGHRGGLGETLGMDGGLFALIALVALVYFLLMHRLAMVPPPSGEQARKLARRALLGTALLGVVLVAVVPFDSRDLYGYINRGAQQALYGLNPYAVTVAQTPGWQDNPMFHAHWLTNPCPYGPVFTRVVQGVCLLSGGQFWLAFLLMKGTSLLLHLLNAWLVLQLARCWGLARPWQAVALYGLHPLMLLQLIANGHNDGWVACGMLAMLWLLTVPSGRAGAIAAWPVLMLSALTKYASALAFPLMALLWIRQKRWPALALGAFLSLALAVSLAWPYWHELPPEAWAAMRQNAAMAQHSFHAALGRVVFYAAYALPALRGWEEPVRQAARLLTLGGLGVFLLWALRRSWCELGDDGCTASRANPAWAVQRLGYWLMLTLLVLFTLASAKFHPWYVAMVFPLAVVMPPAVGLADWPRRFALLLASVQLAAFTPLNNLHILNYLLLVALPLGLSYRATRQAVASSTCHESAV